MIKGKQTKQEAQTTNLLISLLMRFPEIMSINYDMQKERCKFTFILNDTVNREKYCAFKKMLNESLSVFRDMTDESFFLSTKITRSGKITLIESTCGAFDLSLDAIQLIISLVDSFFCDIIVRDYDAVEMARDEEVIKQEEIIEYLLCNTTGAKKENLIAFREAGKVYIYDK